MSRTDLAGFLADDFERLVALDPLLATRCEALAGHRLFLTGATGFFGKGLLALLAWLQRRGVAVEVTAMSRDPQRFLDQHAWARSMPALRWMRGDVEQPWPDAGQQTLLLHAATDTHASAHQDLRRVFDHEVASVRQALDFAARAGVQRLLLTGSGAQYGALPSSLAAGVGEDAGLACDATQPASAYGEGKRVAELLAAQHAARHGTAVVPTRCFAFVGPGLDLDGHFAIGNFIRDALAGRPIRLSSSGQALRSYLYLADLAFWLLLLLVEAPSGRAVNVGSGQALSVLQLAAQVRDVLAPQLQVTPGPPRPGETRAVYVPAVERAAALGLAAWTPLPLAIERTAAWHRGNAA